MSARRIRIGDLWIDALGFEQALDAIERLALSGAGGAVYTPNVDHLVTAERSPAFREAYAAASLSLADGMPLLWAARLLGTPLPAKVSGSDLFEPLMARAAAVGLGVYLLGGTPEVSAAAETQLTSAGVRITGRSSPLIQATGGPEEAALAAQIRESGARLAVIALGSPKQELFIHRNRQQLGPVVALGLGAAMDFATGAVRRAPRLLQVAGLEWLFRLAQEPRRLARRYLVDDRRFAAILWRTRRTPRAERQQGY